MSRGETKNPEDERRRRRRASENGDDLWRLAISSDQASPLPVRLPWFVSIDQSIVPILRFGKICSIELQFSVLDVGLIATSALMIMKGLQCVSASKTPAVVVLSESMEPGFKRVSFPPKTATLAQ